MKTWSDYGIQVSLGGHPQQKVSCPECTPTRKKKYLKDLAVNLDDGVFKCFHCGWSGSLKVKKNKDYRPPRQYTKPTPPQNNPIPAKIIEWFLERGISSQTVHKAGVTYETEFFPQMMKKENAIVFNYYLDGEIINKKFRARGKMMRMAKDARLIMYAPLVKNKHVYEGDIYITEGELDTLALLECGVENAVSIPNGAKAINADLSKADFSYLDSLAEIHPDYSNQRIFLIMDTDEVGVHIRDEIARRLGIDKCLKASYPEGCKDINDVLKKEGKEGVKKVLDECRAYPIKGKYNVSDLYEAVYDLYDNGYEKGLSVGWENFDKFYSVRRQEFTIVTGIPSHGKSAFMDHLMVNMASFHNWKFAIFSPENYPFERHVSKLCEVYVGKPFDKKYNGYMDPYEFQEALKWINEHFVFIMPASENYTIDEILKLTKAAIFRDGVNGLLVDPWNEIEHNRGRMSETDYVSQTLSKVRKFGRVNKIHSWIVAHPTKLFKDKKTGKYPVPSPYDISGSSHWRNKADNCLCVFRDFDLKKTTVYVQKVRFKEIGEIGDADFYFDIASGRYHEFNSSEDD